MSEIQTSIDLEKLMKLEELVDLQDLEALTGQEVNHDLLKTYWDQLPNQLIRLGFKVVIALILILIALRLIKLVVKIIRKSMFAAGADESTIHFLCSLVSVLLKILLTFSVCAAFGLDTASIIAVLGSVGVAIGLAVQGSLANLAGGVMILLLKPFKVGDYIVEDTHNHEGTVKEIALFTTKLQTMDNKIVVLPNGVLANTSLTNNNGVKERILDVYVDVPYGTSIEKAREAIETAAERCTFILEQSQFQIVIDSFEGSSIRMRLRCRVPGWNYLNAKWDMNEKILEELEKVDIHMPFQQIDVHMNP